MVKERYSTWTVDLFSLAYQYELFLLTSIFKLQVPGWLYVKTSFLLQPQWMAPEVLRNEPSDEKYANNKSLNLLVDIDAFHAGFLNT